MKSEQFDPELSIVKVLSITARGIWLMNAQCEEHFLPFEHFPWFRDAVVDDVFNVEPLGPDGLRWPALDVDILMDTIRYIDSYPLVARH